MGLPLKLSLKRSSAKPSLLAPFFGEPVDRIPVWLMRQAGRFLPEYQQLKSRHAMQDLFYQKELIKTITLMPIQRFDVDAAIIFSDILLPLEAVGAKIHFKHHFPPQVVCPQQIQLEGSLGCKERFGFVYEAIQDLVGVLDVPLIGFCGGPLTLMTYLFQDRDKEGEFARLKQWHLEDPQSFSRVIDRLTAVCIEHLDLQITAGASACQVFDSWAGKFPEEMFEAYVLKPMEAISSQIAKRGVPLIYFSRHLGKQQGHLNRLKADGLSVDSTLSMQEVQATHRVVQGNLAPEILLTDIATIECEVAKMTAQTDPARWVANLGHGVLPTTPIAHVEKFIELIHNLPVDNRRHRAEDGIGVAVGEETEAGAAVVK